MTRHDDAGRNADKPGRAPSDGNAGASASPSKRKLVLFADGTGNAFTSQESSVWRLYEALDHTQPDQIAYYIKGVGTAGWAPLAALDGATGFGVPSNVRKLYRFLCWNWRSGDEIYIFGFSRGAFTARTLAALIASQGLVPAEIDKVAVSHAEMKRNAMAAWRAYRRNTVPLRKSLPTIWIARLIRDVLLYFYHLIFRHRPYAEVCAAMNGRKDIDIEFLGLFDTVEAFGVPIEELRVAIDWAIWPISFRNHRPSRKVKHICHALALDDERTTFHPLRIDQRNLPEGQVVKEVWFTGVHSDIGGGYPESTLSFVPLVWMTEQLGGQLRFQDGEIEHFRQYQSAIGPMHDSRSGAAVLYRYGPRPISEGAENGGPPIVHFAVVERMLHGCDNYAPIMLPASAKVMLPNGDIKPLTEHDARAAMKNAYLDKATGPQRESEAEAFTAMKAPDAEMARRTRDTVWWRRVAYFALLFMVAVIMLWPMIARSMVGTSKDTVLEGSRFLAVITNIDWYLGAVIAPFANLLRSVLPSYATPWLDISLYYPFLTSVIVAFTLWVWYKNGDLRDTIQERARLAWSSHVHSAHREHVGRPGTLLRIGRWMRLNAGPVRTLFARRLMPGIFLLAVFGSAVLIACNSLFTGRVALGKVCTPPETGEAGKQAKGRPVLDEPLDAAGPFHASDFCRWSGLAVEKNRKYRVWIQIEEPWFDRTIMTGLNGFKTYGWRHYLAWPTRRLLGADWFQPIVRIGTKGMNDLPMQAVNVIPGDELPRRMNPTAPVEEDTKQSKYPVKLDDVTGLPDPTDTEKLKKLQGEVEKMGTFDALPQNETARTVWDTQKLTRAIVAEFVAPDSGEVFFYVNDAVQIYPGFLGWLLPSRIAAYFGPDDQYYKNNSGTARITVQRLPAPDKPASPPANK
ncbi:MAG: DUF2235 domain-containing protein [Bradyrhizobium sp.]|nr:DUF2235 domain-containing protein [Bradyrhizobium sp.]